MSMSLRQVSAMLRGDRSPESLWQQREEMADALDAHVAGMGEAVAWIDDESSVYAGARHPPYGGNWHPLYTAPPIDIAAVREVIAELRMDAPKRPSAHYLADLLTAALPKETPCI